jgi:EAL domain-containing protein (putative c-di-GMP-specific phosphodiesterase class I)
VRVIEPDETTDADTLLREADQALYIAKMHGSGHRHVFNPSAERRDRLRIDRGRAAADALAAGQIEVFYQPIVDITQGRPVGAEALVRWRHPTRGLLVPPLWLDDVMADPVMVEIGDFVLRSALNAVGRLRAEGPIRRVHVNVSATELLDAQFVDRVRAALAAHPNVPASAITLEILESAALHDMATAAAALDTIAATGVHVALDDFGTGYSSLTYLRRLPVSTLKVDRSFVATVATDGADLVIVDGVLRMAEAFDLTVVAEGIETSEQERILVNLGCRYAQGFRYARPMPFDEVGEWATRAKSNGVVAPDSA